MQCLPRLVSLLVAMGSVAAVASAQTTSPPAPAAPVQAPAPPPPQYPTFSIGVLSYLQYDAELENRDGFNAFDVTRAYINVTGELARRVKFRITPDVRRVTDGSVAGSLVFRMKYGYLQYDDLLVKGSWLRAGMHQTPWLDFEEGINRYRVQGTMFAEREGLIPGSADFGVGFLSPLPGGYGEFQVGLYNGEGYARAEVNRAKSLQGRFTVRPFPKGPTLKGLRVSTFYNLDSYDRRQPRRRAIVMGSFEHKRFVGTAEWVGATDRALPTQAANLTRRGTSVFAEVRQDLEGWAAFGRFDRLNNDTALVDRSTRRSIVGAAYWMKWGKTRLGFVFDDEDVRYDTALARPTENRFLGQVHFQF